MARVLRLCEQTKRQTNGYFDINHNGQLDPSGLVKGWAINNAAELLRHAGIEDFSIEAGGDIQVNVGPGNEPWLVGIRSPFNIEEIIKTLEIRSEGVATSGTYIRGQHIYNPLNTSDDIKEVRSLTVIGSDIYEADRFATAAFAMGRAGISFIESYPGLEGYMITEDEIATYTSGFERFVADV
jgi:thiamine biosynthesis lipoprotein